MREELHERYFAWLCNIVCGNRYANNISYSRLLTALHNKDFRYSIPRDVNRANDGIDLRYRFDSRYSSFMSRQPCSVLEMMIALAIRCEETIMDDPNKGDRTGQWFWGMIVNLGLGSMTDDRFDKEITDEIIEQFLDREYEPDGRGGLFTIRNNDTDLRDAEIWHQLCWYLDDIT